MAKRKEIILQEILNSQEVWDEAMGKEKLYVVDAHQKWCGPCTAIVGMLKRIKNELGDDLLRFATAEVDSIDSLEQYRGKCEPNFLFFGCGELIASVRGCNAPLIQETITTSLASEHKVIAGETERKVIHDVYSESPDHEAEETEDEETGDEGVVPKQVTVALIKPDVVQNEQVGEIIAKIEEAGIEILANDERMLTEEEATEFYKSKSGESYFDDLVKYVTSGPCRVLVLTKGETGEGVIDLWRNIIGPFDAAVAKDEHPDSLRSIYGEDATKNALHGSSSEEEAVRELGFFYPDFSPPTYSSGRTLVSRSSGRRSKPVSARPKEQLKRTLAIIRPDALRKHKDAILQKIEEAGFRIAMQKELTLTTEQAEDFYSEHRDKEYFEPLVKQMTCGPVLALCLAHHEAVERWRGMLGPKVVSEAVENEPESLRAQFKVEDEINMLHGSDSADQAESELAKIFKQEQTLAVIKPDAMSEKDKIIEKLKEAGFMISCQKDMNLTKDIAGKIYKSKEGTEFYDDLIDHMTSGDTLMMVLSAENAVEKLREMMGPADPEEAKATNPNSLRALFAKSVMENAIHSPSTKDSAEEKIRIMFGDVNFDWDGTAAHRSSNDSPTAKSEGSVKEKQDEEMAEENTEEASVDEGGEEESGTEQGSADRVVDRAGSQASSRGQVADEGELPDDQGNDDANVHTVTTEEDVAPAPTTENPPNADSAPEESQQQDEASELDSHPPSPHQQTHTPSPTPSPTGLPSTPPVPPKDASPPHTPTPKEASPLPDVPPQTNQDPRTPSPDLKTTPRSSSSSSSSSSDSEHSADRNSAKDLDRKSSPEPHVEQTKATEEEE